MIETSLHTCEFLDSDNDRHVLRGRSMRDLIAHVGPSWPVLLDGKRGVLTGALDVGVAFLEAADAPLHIERLCAADFPVAP